MKRIISIAMLVIATSLILIACSNTVNDKGETKVEESREIGKTKNPILANEMFKVKMPSKFRGLYDTDTKDNSIDFYDNECIKDGYEGWAFGIYLYENASEWAGGPTEKVGELTLNDGKTYDVVIAYPTESQFGFDREMPEKYKNLYDARYEIAGNVTGLNGEKISTTAGTKGEDLYKEVLEKHLTALNEKWDATKLEEENMSTMYVVLAESGNVFDNVGYIYKDISMDGIDELLIGEIAEDEWKGVIYDLYTIVDRKPVHVVSGWDRNRYFSVDGSFVSNEYSSGAGESGTTVYTLITNSPTLFFQYAYKYDEDADKENPWFISYDSKEENKNWESVTEDKIKEMQNRLKHDDFDYIPFSTLK